jgi:amino acid permease
MSLTPRTPSVPMRGDLKENIMEETQDNEKLSSNFQSFMNTVKLFFGNAYLSIPNTFMFAGLIGGLLMFSLVGALNCYTMIQILKVADRHPKIGSYS